MKRKSISDSQSVENISDWILRTEVQPAQTNVSTANAVVDSSRSIQTQLSVVHNNNDIGWCPNSAKAVKDDKKVRLIRKHEYNSTWILFQTNANGAIAFTGNCVCGLEKVKRFVKVHLRCVFRNLKKDKRNADVAPLEKFLRTPM